MKLALLSLVVATVTAAPVSRRAVAVNDTDILQFALTLEHLENVFYKSGITMMNESQFEAAGFSAEYYNNLKYIVHDEEAHVEALTDAIMEAGVDPVAACEYDFPFTDPKSFVTIASVLEGVGSSAYLGAAGLISSKEYLAVAGSILVTESLHTAIQRLSLGEVAAANPYGSSLDLNSVFTLAASFIKSCPQSNMALPVMAFPTLNVTQGSPQAPGNTITFITSPLPTDTFFVTFVNGLTIMSVDATVDNGMITSTIPTVVSGQTYALVTKNNVTSAIDDSMVIAGPAILEVTPNSPTFDPSVT
jgi:hypothetical protein